MSSDIALRASGLSKCYHIYDQPRDRLLQMLFRGRHRFYREFWALKDVSFEVPKGEVVGIIGRNGSGKSTLLQVICGTVAPTSGQVHLQGRVAALLELGSGFNPEFTGLENVFLNANLLGLTRAEVEERLDEILAFADIGEFVHQPVKTYSSGMYLRLAFAVSASVNPDVMIVDETLAVGDVLFQAKCFRRFDSLVSSGTTILFVSHSTEQIVQHCSRAILMDGGKILAEGLPRTITNRYLDTLFGSTRKEDEPDPMPRIEQPRFASLESVFEERPGYNKHEYRWGDSTARIRDFTLTTGDDIGHRTQFRSGDRLVVTVRVEFLNHCSAPIFGLTIRTVEGVTVYGSNSRDVEGGPLLYSVADGESVQVMFTVTLALNSGDYLLSVGVAEDNGAEVVPKDRRYDSIHIHISNDRKSSGFAEFGMECAIMPAHPTLKQCV
jgi:lipopolysaccharide transport system ATP-binding protein